MKRHNKSAPTKAVKYFVFLSLAPSAFPDYTNKMVARSDCQLSNWRRAELLNIKSMIVLENTCMNVMLFLFCWASLPVLQHYLFPVYPRRLNLIVIGNNVNSSVHVESHSGVDKGRSDWLEYVQFVWAPKSLILGTQTSRVPV